MSHSTSLAIVSDAVAGDGLERVARSASEALGHPVTVIRATPGEPVIWPAESVPAACLDELAAAAQAIVRLIGTGALEAEQHDLLRELAGEVSFDVDELVAKARRLGFELGGGAVALCALGDGGAEAPDGGGALVGPVAPGRVIGLVPLHGDFSSEAAALAERLRHAGWQVSVSAPRREPALIRDAVREAMLLADLAAVPEAGVAGQEDTYRLLIGVLLRDQGELEQLRASTIAPVLAYDTEHETELLVTLGTFLARHGSTRETAEAMQLHRHTVGYRLSRVQEVAGLSPHESDGRERLSLGMKAAQILAAWERLSEPG
jgi:hypothetical protein